MTEDVKWQKAKVKELSERAKARVTDRDPEGEEKAMDAGLSEGIRLGLERLEEKRKGGE